MVVRTSAVSLRRLCRISSQVKPIPESLPSSPRPVRHWPAALRLVISAIQARSPDTMWIPWAAVLFHRPTMPAACATTDVSDFIQAVPRRLYGSDLVEQTRVFEAAIYFKKKLFCQRPNLPTPSAPPWMKPCAARKPAKPRPSLVHSAPAIWYDRLLSLSWRQNEHLYPKR